MREHRERGPDGSYPIGEGPKPNVALVKKWVRVGGDKKTLLRGTRSLYLSYRAWGVRVSLCYMDMGCLRTGKEWDCLIGYIGVL